MISVPLQFLPLAEAPQRVGEPVTFGLTWPRGAIRDDSCFQYINNQGQTQPLQTEVLCRWPDGSIRWCLFDLRATCGTGKPLGTITTGDSARDHFTPVNVENTLKNTQELLQGILLTLNGEEVRLPTMAVSSLISGPLRHRDTFEETVIPNVTLSGFVDQYSGIACKKFTFTLTNRNPAEHPGGNWDLGNGGSIVVNEWSIRFPCQATGGKYSLQPDLPFQHFSKDFHLHQASSGGDHWNSENHYNRNRTIPWNIKGFQAFVDSTETNGTRATPVVTLSDNSMSLTMPEFWQNFPKAISANEGRLTLALFPVNQSSPTELQGGEQKTFTFWVSFGPDTITLEPLQWARSPLVVHADPEWYASTKALPYFTPKSVDPHEGYLSLVDQAIVGDDTFFHKREAIDEYGWRNYGDIWGDHEAVGHANRAMVSHYNNQYDCIEGFLVQFLRSGDPRWWQLAWPCADHTVDIDLYHTDGDKAAYNHGLFWHTYHYAPADTGTHRSYPRSLKQGPQASTTTKMDDLGDTAAKLKKAYAVGGGPASSHNYNAGLMLAYYLSGETRYKNAAVDLAKFVLDMEDPNRTPFRYLSREYTGLASESGGGGYHGPGRASANSVLALLVGFRLTSDRLYLLKAEQLIRRVAHPKQELESLDLLNAELRWFYTMFLQALGTYLDEKEEQNELDGMYAYTRETLLHYARWMAKHERPILDTPEKLQYPTETWAAQDMRKVEVFQFAAKHASEDERNLFLEKAEWLFRYVETTLAGYETKSLCRPVVMMMRYGYSRAWWKQNTDAKALLPIAPVYPTGPLKMFTPQKVKAVKRAKLIVGAVALLGAIAVLVLVYWLT